MAKDKTIKVIYNGIGSFSNGTWEIKSGEEQEIPEADYKFLVDTNQAQDISIVK
tara:strand:- start:235 stop:396 length:162 start_codon:yes stop_codon:yes gene_type:complete